VILAGSSEDNRIVGFLGEQGPADARQLIHSWVFIRSFDLTAFPTSDVGADP
jgi:hypothetical protein